MFSIRLATLDDFVTINEIYNHYVLNSTCTFHLEPVTDEERLEWLSHHTERYPVTVVESDGIVVGWASLSQFRPRPAYANTVESSVYIHRDFHRRGLGKLLMTDLVERAKQLKHRSIIAGAEASQTASIRLHQDLGFTKVAYYQEVGFKFGEWHDTVFFQLML